MKQSTEITRFLNHIEREKNALKKEIRVQKTIMDASLADERKARIAAERELKILREKNAVTETASIKTVTQWEAI
jgi:hypothetical protein